MIRKLILKWLGITNLKDIAEERDKLKSDYADKYKRELESLNFKVESLDDDVRDLGNDYRESINSRIKDPNFIKNLIEEINKYQLKIRL